MRNVMKLLPVMTKLLVVCIVILAGVASYCASAWPVALAAIYDALSSGTVSSFEGLLLPLIQFVSLLILAEVLSSCRRVATDLACDSFERDCYMKGLAGALRLPPSEIGSKGNAELSAQIGQGVEGACQMVKLACNDALPAVATTAFVLYQVFIGASPQMLIVFIVYVVATALVSALQISSQNGARDGINLLRNRIGGRIAESLSNHESIMTMAAQQEECNRIGSLIANLRVLTSRHHKAMVSFDAIKQASKALFLCLVLVVGVSLVERGDMSGGSVVAAAMLFNQLNSPLEVFYRLLDEFASSNLKVARLADVLVKSVPPRTNKVTCLNEDEIVLSLDQVVALSPDRKVVSSQIDLDIFCGSVTCLSGSNGCGKSSIMKAAIGYYPFIGDIRISGVPLREWSESQLSSNVFYLTQRPFLFEGTVRENVLYGLEGKFEDARVREALSKALICENEFSDDLLEHRVSENGTNLSGGQRQRLCLARVFLREPTLLLADEATASMDIPAAVAVMDNVKKHMRQCGGTVLLITHQEEIKDLCDRVVRIEQDNASLQPNLVPVDRALSVRSQSIDDRVALPIFGEEASECLEAVSRVHFERPRVAGSAVSAI